VAPRPVPPAALYLHVPFCVSICPYCDFVVYAGVAARGPRSSVERFLDAVSVELELRADLLDDLFGVRRPPLRSVYLGGGTPSLLPAGGIARLLDRVRARFGLEPGAEVTLEANPGVDERGDLRGLRAAGVDRLSLGAQSLDAAELRRLGRRHRPDDVLAAVRGARRAGFEQVSADLLYDTPGQTLESWRETLDRVLETGVGHVSAYALTLDDPDEEGLTGVGGDHLPLRPGARRWRAKARADQDDDRAAEMYDLADERLEAAGLRWYEVSNWARRGEESRHNRAYWRQEPYAAVGPGAHAFDGVTRTWNAAALAPYLSALQPGPAAAPTLPPGGAERLDADGLARERVILGLRTADGVTAEVAQDPRFADALAWAREHRLVESGGVGLRLTRVGRRLSNALFHRLL
jgi:putative oxygen-independent coproporphyrinogen III oxidase